MGIFFYKMHQFHSLGKTPINISRKQHYQTKTAGCGHAGTYKIPL